MAKLKDLKVGDIVVAKYKKMVRDQIFIYDSCDKKVFKNKEGMKIDQIDESDPNLSICLENPNLASTLVWLNPKYLKKIK